MAYRHLLLTLLLCTLWIPRAVAADSFDDTLDESATFYLDAAGTGVHIVGELKDLTPWRFRWFLRKHPDIENVIISSFGGTVESGMQLGRLIRKRGLKTFNIHACYSACNYAFAGGSRRYLVEGSKTGFHSHGLKEEFEYYSDLLFYEMRILEYHVRRHLGKMGLSREMVEKIYRTPLNDVWEPDSEYMIRHGYADVILKKSESPWQIE